MSVPPLNLGTPVTASTTRMGQTQIASATAYSLLGRLLQPVSSQLVFEQFGAQVAMPFCIHVGWPAGVTADTPFEPGDTVTITQAGVPWTGHQYVVFGAKHHYGLFAQLYVQVTQS